MTHMLTLSFNQLSNVKFELEWCRLRYVNRYTELQRGYVQGSDFINSRSSTNYNLIKF